MRFRQYTNKGGTNFELPARANLYPFCWTLRSVSTYTLQKIQHPTAIIYLLSTTESSAVQSTRGIKMWDIMAGSLQSLRIQMGKRTVI
ncbi:hypothetical protein D3C80_1890710 [compost metagenome]